jgi:hypothetical protein
MSRFWGVLRRHLTPPESSPNVEARVDKVDDLAVVEPTSGVGIELSPGTNSPSGKAAPQYS